MFIVGFLTSVVRPLSSVPSSIQNGVPQSRVWPEKSAGGATTASADASAVIGRGSD